MGRCAARTCVNIGFSPPRVRSIAAAARLGLVQTRSGDEIRGPGFIAREFLEQLGVAREVSGQGGTVEEVRADVHVVAGGAGVVVDGVPCREGGIGDDSGRQVEDAGPGGVDVGDDGFPEGVHGVAGAVLQDEGGEETSDNGRVVVEGVGDLGGDVGVAGEAVVGERGVLADLRLVSRWFLF
jgi:hypothetical protein